MAGASLSDALKRASRSAEHTAKRRQGAKPRPARVVQAPEIQHQRRGHAEGEEVGQTVELGAEARGALQQPRQAAVDAVDRAGDHDQHRRVLPSSLEGEAHGGEPGAEAEHGEDVRDQAVEGRPARAGARARPPQALETLPQQPGARRRGGRSVAGASITSASRVFAPRAPGPARVPRSPFRRRSWSGPPPPGAARLPAGRRRCGCRSG